MPRDCLRTRGISLCNEGLCRQVSVACGVTSAASDSRMTNVAPAPGGLTTVLAPW